MALLQKGLIDYNKEIKINGKDAYNKHQDMIADIIQGICKNPVYQTNPQKFKKINNLISDLEKYRNQQL